jgi:OmpA-OmpF porin, OOP family
MCRLLRRMRRLGLGLAAMGLLSACGMQLDSAREAPPPGGAFEAALHQGYLDLAETERSEQDTLDSDLFAERAMALSAGQSVPPEPLSARNLSNSEFGVMFEARSRLLQSFDQGAKEIVPGDAAQAQVMFECWMQELEEGNQPDDIADCKSGYEAAMAEVDEALRYPPPPPPSNIPENVVILLEGPDGRPSAIEIHTDSGRRMTLDEAGEAFELVGLANRIFVPAQEDVDEAFAPALAAEPEKPEIFLLYFASNATTLTAESEAEMSRALASIRARDVTDVSVIGHTDRQGPDDYNFRLSSARANAVRDALISGGADAAVVEADFHGEALPLVPTADGVGEPRNRRVEVTVR